MKTIHTEIEISAPASEIWNRLTDFGSYPDWNPFVRKVEGVPAVGQRLTIRIQPPGARPMTFRPAVLKADRDSELRWIGRFVMPGLFDGDHSFRIETIQPNRVRFIQTERFTGLLVALLWRSIEAPTTRGFVQMNEALQGIVEKGRTAP
jgi:hypothetical protein